MDGYIADEHGDFGWAAPDDEMHTFVNDLERPHGTYLYGRRMFEVMRYWASAPTTGDDPAVLRDYAEIWQAADKIVYSRTLTEVATERTRLERDFEPRAVQALKTSLDRDASVGGPHLAAQAIRAGLVDELRLLLTPIVVGGGNAALPGGVRTQLKLLDERRFGNGCVYLRYRIAN